MNQSDEPILIVCAECTNRVEKTYDWLLANTLLHCPACGRDMAGERAAVVAHVERIRQTIAAGWPERGS